MSFQMRPEDRDEAYLWDMCAAAREVAGFVGGVSEGQYAADRMLQRAVERDLELIGEAAARVSPSYRDAHPEIPWKSIIGQRNVLAHDYGEILVEKIYRVAVNRVPELLAGLEALLPPDDKT
ncbi:MAG: HepT-like ribonuclease domain-containing protein [bacterium]